MAGRTRQRAKGQTRSVFLEEKLAEEIIAGRLLPGTKLEEQALADRFKTSRTPVREALGRLASSGLVEIRPRRGVVVASLSRERLFEMFGAMAELEGICARLAAERMDSEARAGLVALHATATTWVEAGAVKEYEAHNRDFHAAIYRGAENAYIEETTLAIRARLAPFRKAQFHIPGRVAKSHAEHDAVVRAIAGRRPDDAYHAMRAHMLTVSDASAVFALPSLTETL